MIPDIPDYIFYMAAVVGFFVGAVWFFCWSAADDAENADARS